MAKMLCFKIKSKKSNICYRSLILPSEDCLWKTHTTHTTSIKSGTGLNHNAPPQSSSERIDMALGFGNNPSPCRRSVNNHRISKDPDHLILARLEKMSIMISDGRWLKKSLPIFSRWRLLWFVLCWIKEFKNHRSIYTLIIWSKSR